MARERVLIVESFMVESFILIIKKQGYCAYCSIKQSSWFLTLDYEKMEKDFFLTKGMSSYFMQYCIRRPNNRYSGTVRTVPEYLLFGL
jgi:hypothetical protein